MVPSLRGLAPTKAPAQSPAGAGVLGVDANALHAAFDGDARAVLIGPRLGRGHRLCRCERRAGPLV